MKSFTNMLYSVLTVYLPIKFKNFDAIASFCSRPAGKGKCKHAVALLYALIDYAMQDTKKIPEEVACTSKPRQWGRVSAKQLLLTVTSFTDMVSEVVAHNPKKPHSAAIQRERLKTQVKYSSLPETAGSLHFNRIEQLLQHQWVAFAILK